MMPREQSPEAGFGLLEAIVALAIISLALPALYKAMSGAYRAESRLKIHEAALVLARSQLDMVGSNGTIQVGTFAGAYDNGLFWRMTVSPLSNKAGAGISSARPYWIVVEAYDRSGARLVSLQTAKLVRETQ